MPNTKHIRKTGPKSPWTDKALQSDKYDVGMYAYGRQCPNLYLEVRPTKSKRFLFIYFRKGKQTKISLGVYAPARTTLKRARQLADEYNALLSEGQDPRQYLRDKTERERVIPTFKDFVTSVLPKIELGLNNDKTKYEWRNRLLDSDYCQFIHPKRIDEIDERAIARVLEPIWIDKQPTADKLNMMLRRLFDMARAQYRDAVPKNPVDSSMLKPLLPQRNRNTKLERHHRTLRYQEMPRFMADLRGNDSVSSLCLQFLIINALRTRNALDAEWSQVEMDSSPSRVRIPATRMKSGREFSIPLTRRSIQILETVKTRGYPVESKYIFANETGKALSSHALLNFVRRMSQYDTSVHGFRATFRTWAGEHNYDFVLAETQLDHRVGNEVAQAYTHNADYMTQRLKMVQCWEDFIYSNW